MMVSFQMDKGMDLVKWFILMEIFIKVNELMIK